MSGIIDFHSHVLPRVDDGSASLEESLAMLRLEAEQGIRHVVATPHFYARHDTPERFLRRRQASLEHLREAMAQDATLPRVTVGAEVYYFRGMSHTDAISELTIENTQSILVEMPHGTWTEEMYRELERLHTHYGLTPILAHIDRYVRPLQAGRVFATLAELPVLVQVNASCFLQRGMGNMALRFLKKGQIHLLGSDCHDVTDRAPNLASAIQKIREQGGEACIAHLARCQNDVLGVG